MNQTKHKTSLLIKFLPHVLFFLFGTFYLYGFTNYIFFYQEKSTLFLVSVPYLLEHFNQPGGFLEYLGQLQTSFYYYPLIGAILVSIEICGIIYLIQKIGKAISERNVYFLPFIIGSALFYLQTNYQYSAFNNIGVLIQLLLFYRVITFSKDKLEWIPVLLFPGFYFLFGSFSLIFLTLVTIFFIQKKQLLKLIVILGEGIVFFFYGKEFLFFQTTETLIQFPFSFQDIGLQAQLFLITIGFIVLLPVIFQINLIRMNSIFFKKKYLFEFSPFVILIFLILLSLPRIDKKNSHYFHVEKLFYEQKYDEVIQYNSQFPSTNTLTAFFNNVALAESGRLSNSFFSFPQMPDGSTVFLKWEIVSEVLKRGGYFYYSLGMINEAQRWAYEYMVMRGNSPEALKMMIRTDLLKGKYEIASKYISILEKSVFYRKEAAAFRKLLFDGEAIKEHPDLGRKILFDTKQDFFIIADNPAANLDLIIQADSTNIMAIEYKLVTLLLLKDMQGIVDLLPVMEKAGYSRIPKNVEEAVVTFKLLNVGELPKLDRLKINPQTEHRFSTYYKIFQQNQNNKEQAQRALSQDFADTYWYYVFFN